MRARWFKMMAAAGSIGACLACATDKQAHPAWGSGSRGSSMEFYRADAADPDWLARAAAFHGHLGPWVTVGAMIGGDAVRRLETPGHWKIEVICWMPPQKQKPPFSCIVDGLQASCGATMGKRNIRLDDSPSIVTGDLPVVHVIRRPDGDQPARGLVYGIREPLARMLGGTSPDHLEEQSRAISQIPITEAFTIRDMTAEELASLLGAIEMLSPPASAPASR